MVTPPGKKAQDLFEFEAPSLRSTTTTPAAPLALTSPCPDWCSGHEWWAGAGAAGKANHASPSLRVGTDFDFGYEDAKESDRRHKAHVRAWLTQQSRERDPRIRVGRARGDGYGDPDLERSFDLYPDEARELIAVLQYLLKVGQESVSE